jgi:undecaprenyl diphosphate synthase
MLKKLEAGGKEFTLDTGRLPRHIAIIMDGNGRWAQKRGLPRVAGHRAAIESVRDVVRGCGELQIEVLTLYAFSVENWSRPQEEVRALMRMLRELLRREVRELHRSNVRLTSTGRLEDLSGGVREELLRAIEKTRTNSGLVLNLALSYGGRSEIVDAVKAWFEDVRAGRANPENLDEAAFARYLYTRDLPDPDLLIRTSGELRVSNFLLWQIAYTELFITPVLWPDFRRQQLYEAIREYQKRERRFGRVL